MSQVRATTPMSRPATRAADNEFYRRHPGMVVNGCRVPLDPANPKQAALRTEWIQLYQEKGGKVEKIRPRQVAHQIRRASKEARRHSSQTGVTGAVATCPGSRPPRPDPEKIVQTSKPHKPPIPCRLVGTVITCSHGRQGPPGGILSVVPDSYGSIGDKINCVAQLVGGCGRHVEWTIGGMWDATEHGSKTTFLAKAFKPALLSGWLGLHRVQAQTYRVNATACEGGASMVQILSYPPDKLSGKLDFEEIRKTIKKAFAFAPINEEKKREIEKGWFLGSVEYAQQWKEDPKSHRAFCETEVSGGFDPFFGAKLPPVPIYPLSVVPPALQEWLKVGLYFSLAGGFGFKVSVFWRYWPENDRDEFEKGEVSLFGKLSGKLSLNLFVVSEDLISAEVAGGTGVLAGGRLVVEKPVGLEVFLKWTGLEGSFTLKVAWGWIEYNRTYVLIKESEKIFAKHEFGEGGE